MVFLKAKNPDIGSLEGTAVKTAASAGATSMDVDWTEGFSANDYIVIGELGTETAEMVQISSVTDSDTLAVAALVHAHLVNEPVRKTLFNQIRFYDSDDSFASPINTSDVDWANPDQFTVHDDTAGTTSTTYKYTHFNSQGTVESDKSDEFSVPTYYCSLADVQDYLNLSFDQEGEIKSHQVTKFIRLATVETDSLTNSSYKTNTISSSDYEYHDGKKSSDNRYYTKNRPIISVTTLQTTTSHESVGPTNATWTTITLNDDFTVDSDNGEITIVDDSTLPTVGDNRLRVAYTWGHATVPDEIRYLTTLLAVRQMIKANNNRNIITGKEGNAQNLDGLNKEIDAIVSRHDFGRILNS